MYNINRNDIIETDLNFDITTSDSFSFSKKSILEKKDTDLVYYSDYYFEGLINNYSRKLENVTTSLVYGKIIDNSFLVYVEFGKSMINPFIYVIGKSNYEWYGVKYMCNFNYNYNEILDKSQSVVKHSFISDEEKKDEYSYIKYIEENFSSQLTDMRVKSIHDYFKNNFDKEAIKVLELLKKQLNNRFNEAFESMKTSINNDNYDNVDSSYMYLLSGSDNWLPLRNSFNYLLDLEKLKGKGLTKK